MLTDGVNFGYILYTSMLAYKFPLNGLIFYIVSDHIS